MHLERLRESRLDTARVRHAGQCLGAKEDLDLDLAAQADRFDFAMPVSRQGDRLVIL